MYFCGVVLIFLAQRDKRVAVFDAIHEVGTTLYHPLIHQFAEGFVFAYNA